MDYNELVEKAKDLDEKATPGPWMWDLNECNHQCFLETTHSGRYYVMGFERWGMQNALPTFQVYERYNGPMKDRGSHGIIRADKLSKSYPGKEHHVGFDNLIDHPDARYIAESRELFHLMIIAITDLLARAESAEARAEKAERERDYAIKQLKIAADENGGCWGCKWFDDMTEKCTNPEGMVSCNTVTNNMWEWRGLKEE